MTNETASKILKGIAEKFRENGRSDIAPVLELMSVALEIDVAMAIFSKIADNARTPLDEKIWESRVDIARQEGRVEGTGEMIKAIKKAFGITDEQIADVWPDSLE